MRRASSSTMSSDHVCTFVSCLERQHSRIAWQSHRNTVVLPIVFFGAEHELIRPELSSLNISSMQFGIVFSVGALLYIRFSAVLGRCGVVRVSSLRCW